MNQILLGNVGVVTTNGRPHSLEFHADRIVERLIHVSENAPEPIKAQALIFKDSLKKIILAGLQDVVNSDRMYRNSIKET